MPVFILVLQLHLFVWHALCLLSCGAKSTNAGARRLRWPVRIVSSALVVIW